MPSLSPSSRVATGYPQRSLRWIVILLASILLHVLAVNWANGHIELPSLRSEQAPVIKTELIAPPPKAAPPVAVAPKRKPKPRPRRAPVPPPVQPPAVEPPVETIDTFAASQPVVEPVMPDAAVEAAPAEVPAQAVETEQAPETATVSYKIDPPPPAELTYDVQALRDGNQWYGSGLFQWSREGNTYTITGEASVTFLFKITVLNFRSEGAINQFGIAPVLYSEKPWRKSMTNTHFQHEQQKISFSASEATFPYKGGEQDRASIMWQLAGIGRGDAGQFVPGATLDIVVAGARKAETWQIRVVGQEQIETGYGTMQAWHVVRAPQPGSYDQTIDIWLAPQHEWYPVKLRYTYANGDHLDMSLSDLKQAAVQ
ncbi:MAG TPA: DUF3108 domain-containing protein [Noviherbaspirillum sp.]